MKMNKIRIIIALSAVVGVLMTGIKPVSAHPNAGLAYQGGAVSAYDLIAAMNTLRMANGLAPLVENGIINAVAQATAEVMAANQMSWHIGDVKGRLSAAGYGGGAAVWATENFAVAGNASIDQIMLMWADESHMIPAVKPAYCNVGAGVAKSANGLTYYVLQAAYVGGGSCAGGSGAGTVNNPVQSGTKVSGAVGVSQIIVPVELATPDSQGKLYHTVKAGQSFWAIAVAYQVTIDDIAAWNGISRTAPLMMNQKLFIPGKDTIGYLTPTPYGMFVPSTPDSTGKIYHIVQAHQALSSIAEAYNVSVETILALNNWQLDWPLQIGQKLLIFPGNVTPTPTVKPLSALEKLTPDASGNLYHIVGSNETISWIADLYGVNMYDLMQWNNLNNSSILYPGDKLLLKITLPATLTPTPGPATLTPVPTRTPFLTYTPLPTSAATPVATQEVKKTATINKDRLLGIIILTFVVTGGLGLFFFSRKKSI